MAEQSSLYFDETIFIVSRSPSGSSLQKGFDLVSKMDSKYDAWSVSWPPQSNQDRDIAHAFLDRQIDIKSGSLPAHKLPAVISFQCTPAHLLSISVEVVSRRTAVSNGKADALFHADLKRQLVGNVFLQSNDEIFVELKGARLQVKTVTLREKSQAPTFPFITVVPSTRITIHEKRDISRIDYKPSDLSHVAKILIDAIQCVKKQIPIPRTFLLSGNPGVGKTFSVKAAYSQCASFVKMVSLRGSELLQNDSNPARALERDFMHALSVASNSVVLLFLDECDALVSIDSVASVLAILLDRVGQSEQQLIVVGATNRVDSIPLWLRRAGRFDCEIPVLPPGAEQRKQVLLKLFREKTTGHLSGKDSDEILRISETTVGYVPADLNALLQRAIFLRQREESTTPRKSISSTSIVGHLEGAMQDVGASSLRDAALSKPPNTDWNDVVGDPGGAKVRLLFACSSTVSFLDDALNHRKTALRQAIEWPRQKKGAFKELGLTPPRGYVCICFFYAFYHFKLGSSCFPIFLQRVLLHGPPGCSKTTLARAAAGASGVAFLSLSPAQVYASSYVGEAERIVRRSFTLARAAAPCILFFDEVDAIFGDGNRGNSAEARVLSTFLNEMDGVDNNAKSDCAVLVLGATNRPWALDSALLRPGRLGDKIVYVPPPDHDARKLILQKQIPGGKVIDFEAMAVMCETMTGAEIIGACQAAKMRLLRDMKVCENNTIGNDLNKTFEQDYLVDAIQAIKPVLSNLKTLDHFRKFDNDDWQ